MPYLALDLGCHTTRAVTLSGRRSVECRSRAAVGGAWPLRAGVVVDVRGAADLVEEVLRRVRQLRLGRWKVLACAPSTATRVERLALVDALERAGAVVVAVVPEPLAAAIGCGVDVAEPWAQMLVDIGHGLTDVAVLRSGKLIATTSLDDACAAVQHAVACALAVDPGASVVDEGAAERVCRDLAPLRRRDALSMAGGHGRHPAYAADASERVLSAADSVLDRIAGGIARFANELPAAIACEVIESGIVLSGGGALLDGLAGRVAAATAIPVRVAADPLSAVVDGARSLLAAARATGPIAL